MLRAALIVIVIAGDGMRVQAVTQSQAWKTQSHILVRHVAIQCLLHIQCTVVELAICKPMGCTQHFAPQWKRYNLVCARISRDNLTSIAMTYIEAFYLLFSRVYGMESLIYIA